MNHRFVYYAFKTLKNRRHVTRTQPQSRLHSHLHAKLFIFYHQFNFILIFVWVVGFLVAGVCAFSFLESLVSPGMQRILDFGPVSKHVVAFVDIMQQFALLNVNYMKFLHIRFFDLLFELKCLDIQTHAFDIHNGISHWDKTGHENDTKAAVTINAWKSESFLYCGVLFSVII